MPTYTTHLDPSRCPQLEEIRQTGHLPELLPPRMTERALPPYGSIER